jgi:broad specificity phosphatase PhoE
MPRRSVTAMGTLLGAALLVLASALPAWAAQSITLTWVRHAQSTANAAGIIDTTVPGPGLTALGESQARAIAEALKANSYDGIFVSDMVRTQLTAAPLAADLDITPIVLPGLQEINAGIFEGRGGLLAGIGYAVAPASWVLGGRFVPVLGGENGNRFQARVEHAVAQIYATGDTNPIAFSHGATIMAWTLMNVENPDLLLALTHPLGNTAVVEVTGNPEDGWTLHSWDGVAVDPDPGLLSRVFVGVRELLVAPQTALYDLCQMVRVDESVPDSARRSAPVHPVGATVPVTPDPPRPPTVDPAEPSSLAVGVGIRRWTAPRMVPPAAAARPGPADAARSTNVRDRPAAGPRKAVRTHASARRAA